jgi:hypothetical protein
MNFQKILRAIASSSSTLNTSGNGIMLVAGEYLEVAKR